MTPEEIALIRLRKELQAELEALERLKEEFEQLPASPDPVPPYLTRAKASIFHDFYSGAERAFVRIARALEGSVPAGEQWHRDLLFEMSLALEEVRPPVISEDLRDKLSAFLRFRHLFRNMYGYALDPGRLRELKVGFEQTASELRTQVRSFLDWLTGKGS